MNNILNIKIKGIVARLTILMVFLAGFSTFSILGSDYSYGMDKVCKVTASNLYVRSKTSTSSSKVGKIKKGTYKVVLSTKKDKKGKTWYRVKVGSKKGYISSSYAKLVSVSISKVSNLKGTVNVSKGNVILRSGPGAIYKSTGKLAKGKTFTITGKAKDVYGIDWYQLKYKKKTCYVSSKYAKTSSIKSTASTTKATTATTKATTKATTSTTKATTNTSSTSNNVTTYVVTALTNLTGKVNTTSNPLTVRNSPATNGTKIGSLAKGKTFNITGKTTVEDIIWYRLTYEGKTGFVSGLYVNVSQTSTATESSTAGKDTDDPRTLKARQAAVDWGIDIANDNSFHYGETKWAHHNGCYFCGTNQSTDSLKIKAGATKAEALKTYCCNPFVTAAYNHGAGAKEMDCKVSSMRVGLAKDPNKVFKNTAAWLNVSKPSKSSSLKVGDILLTDTHAMIYAGNGKVVHAAGHDDGKKNSKMWNNSITYGKLSDYQWNRIKKIYRYLGTGKF